MNNDFSDCQNTTPAILGLESSTLNDNEKSFFKDLNPLGFILFARNCDNPDQVRALSESLKELLGRNCPILIDQEGGRVQRLKPPYFRSFPAMDTFGKQALEVSMDDALEDLRFTALQMIEDLNNCGVNVNCTPVADVLAPQTHDVIGDRAFSDDPAIVSRLALSICRQYLASDVTPIMKHIPGHGRADQDSHFDLPVVKTAHAALSKSDFRPFADIAKSEIGDHVWAMSAHVIYSDLDAELPATLSPYVIDSVIRKEIGFNGILVSDDLEMKALDGFGDMGDRALKSLEAGCDLLLHCSGKMESMVELAEKLPKISENAIKRLQKSSEFRKKAA